VTSDLVRLRVVVRDSRGDHVAGLHKEDFKLFDREEEQAITQFDTKVTSPTAAKSSPPIALPHSVMVP
jgi:hypothetical protein